MSRKTATVCNRRFMLPAMFSVITKLMIATVLPSEAMLKVREKVVVFCKLLLYLENDFLSDFAEGGKKTDCVIPGGKLCGLSSFQDADECCKYPQAPKVVQLQDGVDNTADY